MDFRGLEIRLLGTCEFRTHAGDLPMHRWSLKTRALLVYLIWRRQPVERGILCGLLWPDVPEERARLSLRVALSHLRSALGERIHADRRRVAFVPRPTDNIDVARLLVPAAIDSLAHVDPTLPPAEDSSFSARPAEEPAALAPALATGAFAAGLDDQPGLPSEFVTWLTQVRAEVDAKLRDVGAKPSGHRRNQSLVDGTGADEKGGEGDGGVEDRDDPTEIELLRALVDRDPVHEATARDLMLALARSGAFAEAVAHYTHFATELHRRTGLTPDSASTRLRERIDAARARTERHTLPPRPSVAVPPEIDRLVGWLRMPGCRLVTLIGPTGSGRRTLAHDAAITLRRSFLDGVLWLAGGPDAPALVDSGHAALVDLGDSLQMSVAKVRSDADWRDQERLLVLGGARSDRGGRDSLTELLQMAPGLKAIVISRQPLGLVFEQRIRIGL